MDNEEGLTFDKFMDDILLKESREKKRDVEEDEEPPMLRYSKLRRENTGHLIRYNKVK